MDAAEHAAYFAVDSDGLRVELGLTPDVGQGGEPRAGFRLEGEMFEVDFKMAVWTTAPNSEEAYFLS